MGGKMAQCKLDAIGRGPRHGIRLNGRILCNFDFFDRKSASNSKGVSYPALLHFGRKNAHVRIRGECTRQSKHIATLDSIIVCDEDTCLLVF